MLHPVFFYFFSVLLFLIIQVYENSLTFNNTFISSPLRCQNDFLLLALQGPLLTDHYPLVSMLIVLIGPTCTTPPTNKKKSKNKYYNNNNS